MSASSRDDVKHLVSNEGAVVRETFREQDSPRSMPRVPAERVAPYLERLPPWQRVPPNAREVRRTAGTLLDHAPPEGILGWRNEARSIRGKPRFGRERASSHQTQKPSAQHKQPSSGLL